MTDEGKTYAIILIKIYTITHILQVIWVRLHGHLILALPTPEELNWKELCIDKKNLSPIYTKSFGKVITKCCFSWAHWAVSFQRLPNVAKSGWIFTGISRRDFPKMGFHSLNQYLLNCTSVFQCFKKTNFHKEKYSNFIIIGKTTFSKLIPGNGRTILPKHALKKRQKADLGSYLGEGGRGP